MIAKHAPVLVVVSLALLLITDYSVLQLRDVCLLMDTSITKPELQKDVQMDA